MVETSTCYPCVWNRTIAASLRKEPRLGRPNFENYPSAQDGYHARIPDSDLGKAAPQRVSKLHMRGFFSNDPNACSPRLETATRLDKGECMMQVARAVIDLNHLLASGSMLLCKQRRQPAEMSIDSDSELALSDRGVIKFERPLVCLMRAFQPTGLLVRVHCGNLFVRGYAGYKRADPGPVLIIHI